MDLKCKLLHPEAKVPVYMPGASAFDLSSTDHVVVAPSGGVAMIGTGLAFAVPDGHMLVVNSRSGHGARQIRLANSQGWIDSGYRGEVKIILENFGNHPIKVEPGDRIAQAAIVPMPGVNFVVCDELDQTERGSGGFGSTGVK